MLSFILFVVLVVSLLVMTITVSSGNKSTGITALAVAALTSVAMLLWMSDSPIAIDNPSIYVIILLFSVGGALLTNGNKVMMSVAGLAALSLIMGTVMTWEVFNAQRYRELITISKVKREIPSLSGKNFKIPASPDVALQQMNKVIPQELSAMYEIGALTRQVDGEGNIMYVAPLEHTRFLRAFMNESTPGYIQMKATDLMSAKLVTKLGNADIHIKYSVSNIGFHDVNRALFFSDITSYISNARFYLDDNGKPYWVASVMEKKVGFAGRDVVGVRVMDAQTGDIKNYSVKNAPKWIDRLYPTDVIETQISDFFQLVHGAFNFEGKDILEVKHAADFVQIEGITYEYLPLGNSNNQTATTAVVLINSRTKEVTKYNLNAIAEDVAKQQAQQATRANGYVADDALPIRLEGFPVFVMQLRSDTGAVSSYGIVSMANQQVFAVGNTVEDTYRAFIQKMADVGNSDVRLSANVVKKSVKGQIARIATEVVNGNTLFYFMIKDDGSVYSISRNLSDKLPLVMAGDEVEVEYRDGNGVKTVTSFKTKF